MHAWRMASVFERFSISSLGRASHLSACRVGGKGIGITSPQPTGLRMEGRPDDMQSASRRIDRALPRGACTSYVSALSILCFFFPRDAFLSYLYAAFSGEGKDRDVLYHKSSFTGAGLEQDGGEFWKIPRRI